MNNLRKLRNSYGLSVRKLESILNINHQSILDYENETTDFNTKNLKILSDFFMVTTDYMLYNSSYGYYLKYKKGSIKFLVKEFLFEQLSDYIYYEDNIRYLDLNRLIDVSDNLDLTELIIEFYKIELTEALFEKKNVNMEDFNFLDKDFKVIDLTSYLIKNIKAAIK